jgi:preprotein translocase subunit SecE
VRAPSKFSGAATCRIALGKHAYMAKFNPFEFVQEVRQEVSKVTWPTWKEVWITTVMVLIMVTLASLFFLFIDQVLGWLINMVLGLGR